MLPFMHEQEYEKSPLQKPTSFADRTPANGVSAPEQNNGQKPQLKKRPQNARPMNGKSFRGNSRKCKGKLILRSTSP